MNQSKPSKKARRFPQRRASVESAFAPPEVWVTKLERLMQERDELLAKQEHLMAARARLYPRRPLQSKGTELKSKELASSFGQFENSCHDYTDLFNFAPVGYVVLDRKGQIQEINQTGCQLLGLAHGNLVRQFLSGFLVREDVVKFLGHLGRCKASGEKVATELQLRQKKGPPLPVELVSAPFENPVNHFVQYRTAIIDITQRRQTEKTLQQVEQDYHALIDSIQGLVWEARAQGGSWWFTFISQQAEQLLGYSAQRWLLEPDFWEQRLHPDDRTTVKTARAQALQHGRDHVLEYRMINAERQVIWVRDGVTIKKDGDRLKLEGILINITELKEMEMALRQSNTQLEVRVGQRTAALARTCAELHTEMRERKRLEQELLELTESGRRQDGMDFHGDVGQNLAGIALMVKGLGSKLEKTSPKEADQAERIQSLVGETMARVHDPAQDFASFQMPEENLPTALKGLAARAQSLFEVPCRFKPSGPIPPLDQDVATQFFNIAQEAIVEAVRYGKAGQIMLLLSSRSSRLVLTVQYEGRPFATPLHHSLELGMKIMNYRANLIGADLETSEQGEKGGLVTCTFPAKQKG